VSYIDKNSSTVISARLTDEGKRLLSLGLLTFDTFRLGDSNIDYTTLGSSYNISLENIIRAKADNPDIKTPIKPTPNATTTYSSIPTLSPVILNTLITAPKLGFFEYGSGTTIQYTASTDTVCHVLQADTVIPVTGMTGSNTVPVKQGPTYALNTYEPKIGDIMMVKMSNNELSIQGAPAVVDLTTPVPYLWYQVQGTSGALSTNNLLVTVDRNFANFSGYSTSNNANVIFYPLGTGGTQNSLFSSGGFFSGGCVWNMNNVWSQPMPGVNPATYEIFNNYGSETYIGSKEYFGYTSEIAYQYTANTACNLVPAISIIHYTNVDSCANTSELKYGQKLYIDNATSVSPKLIMPTLMWHKNLTGTTIGQTFTADTSAQLFVKLSGQNTTVSYYNLVDGYGNKVGRVFPNLQIFTIDDQELVAALSYKSNRNWTLPTLQGQTIVSTDGVVDSTENLFVTYLLESSSGYTTGLHCQNIICINYLNNDNSTLDCKPTDTSNSALLTKRAVNVNLPLGQLPYMNLGGGQGWYADKFYLLVQKQSLGTNPNPSSWVKIDYTSQINGHTAGTRITPSNLEATTFTVTNTAYNSSGSTYNLNDFIKIPQVAQNEYLNFGDERFFYGNIEAIGSSNKYRTKFSFTVPPNIFNTSTNPTWTTNANQNVRIDEIGVYDVNKKLVAIGKTNNPIEKVPNSTIIIEIAFDI
jgi:hypothetical protein